MSIRLCDFMHVICRNKPKNSSHFKSLSANVPARLGTKNGAHRLGARRFVLSFKYLQRQLPFVDIKLCLFSGFNVKVVVFYVDCKRIAVFALALQNEFSKQRFDGVLNKSTQRSCAVYGVITVVDDIFFCFFGDDKVKSLVLKHVADAFYHKIDDSKRLLFSQRLKRDYFVESV